MNSNLLLLIITVSVALIFDFLNGFHDAANSIATVVSKRVLSPKLAVAWAAFFNFVAAFFLGTAVAKTIGKGMVRIDSVTQYVVIAGLLGAIVWDLLTWWWALPTSSSHALIGGYAGAAIMRSGFHVIIIEGWYKTLIFIVVAPIMGLVLGFSFMVAIFWLLRNKPPQRIDGWFRKLQLLSAAGYSLGHGGNDAQKTMGIVAGALYSAKYMSAYDMANNWGHFHWPIILAAHTAIALGTYFGGWRIVHPGLAHLWLNQSEVSAPKRPEPSHCSLPLWQEFPSAPPTPSPARLSAWVPLIACPPSAGASLEKSSGPGS